MTDTNQKLRALVLTAIMVLSVVAMTVSLSGGAAAASSTRGNISGTPVVMFLGETGIDVTAADTGTVSFRGVAGEADGGLVSDDAGSVDFTEANGFEVGGYNTSGSGTAVDYSVRRAAVNDVDVHLGETSGGADVTGATVPNDQGNVTIQAEFNFDQATYVEVEVIDDEGIDVTNELNSTQRIESNGGTLILRNVDGLAPGTYTVEVGAPGPSGLAYASQSAEFTIASTATSLSLGQSEVTQGQTVIATVSGTPGENVTVRTAKSNLVSGSFASNLFANTADVLNRTNVTTTGGSTTYEGVILDLGDDGQAQTRLRTTHLSAARTPEIQAVSGGNASGISASTSNVQRADLRINRRSVSISATNSVIAGETFDITGTAPQSSEVQAFVRIGDRWVPLNDTSSFAEDTSIASDGSYEITVSTATDDSPDISIPDTYQIAVAAAGTGQSISDSSKDRTTFNALTNAKRSISVTQGSLSLSLSESRIALGDDVEITGNAIGQGDTVRVYVVGPRGGVGWSSTTVDDNEFSADFPTDFSNGVAGGANFDRTGTHTVMVIGAGRNQQFANSTIDIGLSSGSLSSEQIALIEDSYTGAGVDDTIQRATFVGENAVVDLDPVGTNGQLTPSEVTISGTSNREDGTSIFVDVVTGNGNVLASGDAEVDGASDEWSVDVDLSDVSTGQTVVVRAEDDAGNSDRQEVDMVSSISTPAPTTTAPPQTVTVTETVVQTQTVTVTQDRTVTVTVTPSDTDSGGQPGFGIAIAIVALLGAGLLALRRRD